MSILDTGKYPFATTYIDIQYQQHWLSEDAAMYVQVVCNHDELVAFEQCCWEYACLVGVQFAVHVVLQVVRLNAEGAVCACWFEWEWLVVYFVGYGLLY